MFFLYNKCHLRKYYVLIGATYVKRSNYLNSTTLMNVNSFLCFTKTEPVQLVILGILSLLKLAKFHLLKYNEFVAIENNLVAMFHF